LGVFRSQLKSSDRLVARVFPLTSAGFGINGQVEGNEDGYYSNMLYMMKDGNYGSGQTCSGAGMTAVFNNTVWSPTGTVSECGMTLSQWQAKGGDPGTVATPFPADDVVLTNARALLGVSTH
jgi:hypothetical protein